jgi:hypothetical protein
MRYPEWKELRDFKEKVQLKVGLKFANPPQFKDALKLFTSQNLFDYTYL